MMYRLGGEKSFFHAVMCQAQTKTNNIRAAVFFSGMGRKIRRRDSAASTELSRTENSVNKENRKIAKIKKCCRFALT
jgi:hypothetical protein